MSIHLAARRAFIDGIIENRWCLMKRTTKRPDAETAKRALAEAEERRRQKPKDVQGEKEFQGREGPDPARYGDWENKGIASDF